MAALSAAADTSVLIAAILENEPQHAACRNLVDRGGLKVWGHAMAELFSTLTGGRHGWRATPATASELIDDLQAQEVRFLDLCATDVAEAIRHAQVVGARGGAVYDYLHLVAARRAGARFFYTLNVRHFAAVSRAGDPQILSPEL